MDYSLLVSFLSLHLIYCYHSCLLKTQVFGYYNALQCFYKFSDISPCSRSMSKTDVFSHWGVGVHAVSHSNWNGLGKHYFLNLAAQHVNFLIFLPLQIVGILSSQTHTWKKMKVYLGKLYRFKILFQNICFRSWKISNIMWRNTNHVGLVCFLCV